MIVEIAHFCLILAFFVSILGAIIPMVGSFYTESPLIRLSRPTALVQFVLVMLSFAGLVFAFATDDFTVQYVADHSNSRLPMGFKVSAVWGAHEGSMLLWILILSGWSAAVALFSRNIPNEAVARVLSVMSFISVGFLSFSIFTSNPFERVLPFFPIDGRDLNPLLQDIGMIIHPPVLYMGYVGFSVAFAFAISALIRGELDSAWARWSRPWTQAAWLCLTLGIALGSWWAYYELGWGGWWFWDPVENASFMPWLSGTALLHTLAVSEKRNVFKTWTVFLALTTFSLSLFGTFLVRSGVITSVHSFAQDPVRGIYILSFIGVVIIASVILFLFRGSAVRSTGTFALLSREFFLLLNNILLIVALFIVFLGTIFPLILEAFDRSISVGAGFFDLWFSVIMVPLFLLMGIGPWMHWKKLHKEKLLKNGLKVIAIASVVFVIATSQMWPVKYWQVWLGMVLAAWIVAAILFDIIDKTKHGNSLFRAVAKLKPSYWGMQLAHFGIVFVIIGVVLVNFTSYETLIRLAPGETFKENQLTIQFNSIEDKKGPNYLSTEGQFSIVYKDDSFPLVAEKRRYYASGQVMTEAGIDAGFFRDVYLSLGEPINEKDWSIRIYVKSFVRWIWLGAILMALGGLLSMSDKRYRVKLKTKLKPSLIS